MIKELVQTNFLSVLRGLIPLFDENFRLFLKWGLKGSIKAYKRP
ncbi:membrane protein [Helicobacter pylori]|nr:membrane protein [Helicobacter pylori]